LNNIGQGIYKISDQKSLYFDSINLTFSEKETYCTTIGQPTTLLSRLRVELTWKCNLSCSYCLVYGNEVPDKIQSMSPMIAINTMTDFLNDAIKEHHKLSLLIMGGEPLLCKDTLFSLVERFPGTSYIITNGTLVTNKIASTLSKLRSICYVSLDGPSERDNLNRCFKNGQNSFRKIIDGYKRLCDAGVRTGIMIVAQPDTVVRGADIVEQIIYELFPFEVGYSLPHWSKREIIPVSPKIYAEQLLRLYEKRQSLRVPILQLAWRIHPIIYQQPKWYSCMIEGSQRTVLPDGTIVLCSKLASNEKYKKLNHSDILSFSPLFVQKNDGLESKCYTCIAVGICGGGCPWDGMIRFGFGRDLRECEINPLLASAIINDIVAGYATSNKNILDVIKEVLLPYG
jgi:uncharacterized protein